MGGHCLCQLVVSLNRLTFWLFMLFYEWKLLSCYLSDVTKLCVIQYNTNIIMVALTRVLKSMLFK